MSSLWAHMGAIGCIGLRRGAVHAAEPHLKDETLKATIHEQLCCAQLLQQSYLVYDAKLLVVCHTKHVASKYSWQHVPHYFKGVHRLSEPSAGEQSSVRYFSSL